MCMWMFCNTDEVFDCALERNTILGSKTKKKNIVQIQKFVGKSWKQMVQLSVSSQLI